MDKTIIKSSIKIHLSWAHLYKEIFLLKLQQIYNLIEIKREIHLNITTLLNRALVKQLNENINWYIINHMNEQRELGFDTFFYH